MQFSVDDLVRLARRDNNQIRPYLYVNPKQGKHIPANPTDILGMCRELANEVNNAYPNERLFVIGFAETATGIASAVSKYLININYYQNTTREHSSCEESLIFTESHSHAKEQMLRTFGIENAITMIDRIVFIDDEVTTGNTICKLIDMIKCNYDAGKIQFTIVSILNSMTSERISELAKRGIDCIFLARIPFEYKKDEIWNVPVEQDCNHALRNHHATIADEMIYECGLDPRSAIPFSDYQRENDAFAKLVCEELKDCHYGKFLILGTEEFMYATICVGALLEDFGVADTVMVHSTTRSPIIAFDSPSYPLKRRYQIRSFYDPDRITYIYNLEKYDAVLILTDATEYELGLSDLLDALSEAGNKNVYLGRWVYQ